MIGSSASKKERSANEDIISDLPKNVTDMILEALPICDAARTSLLSRKWQNRWVTISKLVFDGKFYSSMSNKYTYFEVKDTINTILLLHIGPIRKFTLQSGYGFSSLENNLSPWLRFLSRNGIKELTLHFSLDHPCKLGLQLFSCLELTHLNLSHCKLNPPSAFKGFPNLTTLELAYMVDLSGKFGDTISACRLLERVSIEGCHGIHNLVVSSPNLKYLHVERVHGLKTICLNSSKKVATLSICFSDAVPGHKMEKLVLGDNILEFPAASSLPKRLLPTSLENLKKIVLSYVDFNDVAQIACTVCMIQSSPKLSELEIWAQCTQSTLYLDRNTVEDYGDLDCTFGQLKTVKLMFLKHLKAEMALVKLLLARSPLLEHISVKVCSGIGSNVAFSLCKRLMRFSRASPKAEIIYLDGY